MRHINYWSLHKKPRSNHMFLGVHWWDSCNGAYEDWVGVRLPVRNEVAVREISTQRCSVTSFLRVYRDCFVGDN